MTDTARLDWLMEKLLTTRSGRLLSELGIAIEELAGPGSKTAGELFVDAIDRRLLEESGKPIT